MGQKTLKILAVFVAGATLAFSTGAGAQQADVSPAQAQGGGQRVRGMGGFPGGGRGILGTVTETAADHYMIKTDSGETFTVYYSANTRIVKPGPGQVGQPGQGRGQGRRSAAGQDADSDTNGGGDRERAQPTPLKPAEIKVGDIITAGGEVDDKKKSIGAVFIAQIDPERAKQMREREANYGKTWLAGRITAIDGTRITVDGLVDHAAHVVEVDENTSFRRRRESITMADIQPGQMLQAEGAVKAGVFLATTVTAQQPRDPNRDPNPGEGNPGAGGANKPSLPPK